MKKNKMMRLASWLLVLTLLTTCIISGTFAKYVTSDDAEDTARVARWGVTTTISGTLFGEHYNALSEDEKTSNQISASYTGSVDRLDAFEDENIVAPGTKSENMKISISGTPEVSGKIDVEVKDTEGTNFSDIWLADGHYGVMVDVTDTVKTGDDIVGLYTKAEGSKDYTLLKAGSTLSEDARYYKLRDTVNMDEYSTNENNPRYVTDEDDPYFDGKKYYPIVWTLNNTKSIGNVEDDDSAIYRVENLKDKINTIITENGDIIESGKFNSQTQLDTHVGDTLIEWEWPFENYTADEDAISPTVDGCDTILGKLMTWDNGSKYQVVKISEAGIPTTCTGVTTKEETNGVTYAVVGEGENEEKVACLTVGFNIKVTVSQVD